MSKPITTRINHSSSLGMKVREPLLDVGSVAKQQLEDVNESEENRIIITSGTPDRTDVIDPDVVQGDLIPKEPSTNRVEPGSDEEAYYLKEKKRCDKLTNEQKLDPKNKCTGFAQKRKPDTKKCKEGYTMNAQGKCEKTVKGDEVKKALQTYDRGTALSNYDMRQDIRAGKFQNRLSKQATDKQKAESIPEEDNHHNQMMQGKLSYNHETVTWKQSTKDAPRVYKRLEGGILEAAGKKAREGAHGFPWEAEAKKNI